MTNVETARSLLAIVCGAVFVLLGACVGCEFNLSERAADAARAHLDKLGFPYSGVACVARDTDGDGYVSCTISDAQHQMTALECVGTKWTFNAGCRVPKAQLPGTRE